MQVQSIQPYNCYKPAFKAWEREVLFDTDKNSFASRLKHRNDTSFYRDEGLWKSLVDFVYEKFAAEPRVYVYSYGCSNGSEPYTFAMQMISAHPEGSDKYFPIIAKDYDKVAIDMAKTHKLPIDDYEISVIKYYTNNKLSEFGEITKDKRGKDCIFSLKPDFAKKIDFSVADVVSDSKRIKREPSIVLGRNFWPYLEHYKVPQLIKNLGDRLVEGSLVVLGQYDIKVNYDWRNIDMLKLFRDNGFKPTRIHNVLEKVKI